MMVFFSMLKVVMARGKRLKKGGGDLEIRKQNVASLKQGITEQIIASSNQPIREQDVVPSKLRPKEQNVASLEMKIENWCSK